MPSRPAPSRPADHLRLVTPAREAPAPTSLRSQASRAKAAQPASGRAAAGARSLGDWTLHGLGVGAATASAGFATYALVFSTGQVVPSGNFNLFARYDHLYQPPATHAEPAPDVATAAAPEAAPARAGRGDVARNEAVDFTPTGSLTPGADRAPGEGRTSAGNHPLPNFTLRDVFDGKALVESRTSLSVVRPGSVLEGAGQVLSIEKRGERWVVLTQNGVIAGQTR